ncbi:MAG: hypothetical protein QOK14_1237 [Frankiaceae bacterium]|nr:hypothetical protein [Frankiaceae bacterium]
MSEPHDHDHDHDHGHDGNHGHGGGLGGPSDAHDHLPGPVRSALGLLADGIDRARNLAGPAGERARIVTDKVREESAEVFDKVRDEGTHVVNKLRGHSGPTDAGSPTAGAHRADADDARDRAAEAFDIAKTVGAALLVGAVKAVQLAMREWQAHTGNASTPEDNAPSAAAWDTAGTPKAPATPDADADADADADGQGSAGPQPAPEVNNWDDIEAEVAGDDAWSQETDDLGAVGATAGGESAVPVNDGHVEVAEDLAYTSESPGVADQVTVADVVDSPADVPDDSGAALRTESPPQHAGHGHAHDDPSHTHSAPPLEGFDEMTIGSLRGRLGSLDLGDLEALRDYERDHSARPQVLTMLENRIAKVHAQDADG